MRKLNQLPLLILLLLFFQPAATAIENGDNALGGPVVAWPMWGSVTASCSGALIAPRIVVTAKHCSGPSTKEIMAPIAFPGKSLQDPNLVLARVIEVVTTPGEWDSFDQKDNLDDISFLILEKSFPVSANIIIATSEDLDRFRKNHTPVITYGYGKSGPIRQETIPYSLRGILVEPNDGGFGPNSFNVYLEGIQNICGGDSGGPTYAIENDFLYYIGPTSATRRPSCIEPPIKESGYFGGTPIAYNLNLFKRVQEELSKIELSEAKIAETRKSTPSPTPIPMKTKITINCIRGKVLKNVTGLNPKCPSGFTKK